MGRDEYWVWKSNTTTGDKRWRSIQQLLPLNVRPKITMHGLKTRKCPTALHPSPYKPDFQPRSGQTMMQDPRGMWLGQCPVRVRLPEASALERKPFARGNRAFEHVFSRERGRGAVWSVESMRESLFRCPTTPSPDYMALLPGEQHAILRWRHEGTPRSCKPREIPRPSICRFTPYHQPKERLEHPYPTNQTSSSAVLHAQERTEGRSTR